MNSEEGCISHKTADAYNIFPLNCFKSAFFVSKSFVTEQIIDNQKNIYM